MNFDLTTEQKAIVAMTRAFTNDRIGPHALQWDADKHFPTDVLAQAGALGLGGIYTREDVGGTGLARPGRSLDLSSPGRGLPNRCGLYLDPQYVRLDD